MCDLFQNEKRLIFKVWYLNDPDITTVMNLEKDAVIGFSAVDLSVLMAGLPTVSGWFHIMDFTGKCNGQIKVNYRANFLSGFFFKWNISNYFIYSYLYLDVILDKYNTFR